MNLSIIVGRGIKVWKVSQQYLILWVEVRNASTFYNPVKHRVTMRWERSVKIVETEWWQPAIELEPSTLIFFIQDRSISSSSNALSLCIILYRSALTHDVDEEDEEKCQPFNHCNI